MPDLPANAVAVGIDLGTTYSVVAMVDEFGQPQILPNADNERTTPSVVFIDGNSALVGKIAKDQTHIFTHNIAQFIKPHIGRRRKRFELGGEDWSAEELSAIILCKLVRDAEQALGNSKKITHAVITVPAFFTEQQRKSTEDAGRIAGLNVMGIINEPTAAALAYGFDALGVDKTVVVYDLGGGTFDVTVMRIAGDSITMLATDGDVQLGGKDWDERIIDFAAEQFQEKFGLDPRDDGEVLQNLYGQAEQAKQRLSKLPGTRIQVTAQGKTLPVDITRDQFEALTEDLLAQTETTLTLAVEESGLQFGNINDCLLVGGSTRMPAVRSMLARRLGAEPKHLINPDECVAIGASIHALMLQLRERAKGRPVPEPHVAEQHLARYHQMQEKLINAHTLGIVALNPQGQQVVVPIIPRRAFIPLREIKVFRTPTDNQTQIRIVVMEGESPNPQACTELGTCLIRGLPEGLPKGTPIEVCFECTDDGRLEVTARLPTLEQSVQTQIARTLGMSEAEIEASRERLTRLTIQ